MSVHIRGNGFSLLEKFKNSLNIKTVDEQHLACWRSRKVESSWCRKRHWSAIHIRISFCWLVSSFGTQCARTFRYCNISWTIALTVPTLPPTFYFKIRSVTLQSLFTNSSTLSMRSTVMNVFALRSLGSSTKLLGNPFFHWLVRHTYPCTVTIRRWIAASLTHSAVRNWIMLRFSSIVEFFNMNIILFSYHVNLSALFIRACDVSCACGWTCTLQSRMKIPNAFLDN